MGDLKQEFNRSGFVVVPGVITPVQVRELRQCLLRIFDTEHRFEGDSKQFLADVMCRYPELRWVLAHPPIVSALREVMGHDFVYMHEMPAHDSFFGGWHRDTNSAENAGHTFHRKENFLMVQTALYLQDNGEYGGGLDVVPHSHRWLGVKPGIWKRVRGKLRAFRLWPKETTRGYSVPTKAGDLVLFDFRLIHRASPSMRHEIPLDHRKLAMFFACSANNEHVSTYTAWLASRPTSLWLKEHQYSQEMLAFVDDHNIKLA